MQVRILNAKRTEVALKSPFYVNDFLLESTIFYELEVSINESLVSTTMGQLPLFYKDQDICAYINTTLNFNPRDLSFDQQLPINLLFCLELAILKYAQKSKTEIEPGLVSHFGLNPKVEINSLLIGEPQSKQAQAVVKVKIGRDDIEKENLKIKSLIEYGYRLRLDGNRMLRPAQLFEILRDVDHSRIEYIEEPFSNTLEWEEFKLKNVIKLGLDESLLTHLGNKLPTNTGAFIIKPTYVLGLFKTIELLKDSRYTSISKVISSSFDDEQTINTLIHIAQFQQENIAHGLGTLPHLELKTHLIRQEGSFLQGCPINLF